MKIVPRLLSRLNRIFDKDPKRFLALRINYDGDMTFEIADLVLTTSVTGGTGVDLNVDISAMTIGDLVTHLNAQTGYSVPYYDLDRSGMSAKLLIDLVSTPEQSNGDHIYGFTSNLWAFFTAVGIELWEAEREIPDMLAQMNIHTAEGMWVDEWGGYFGIPRDPSEGDAAYAARIVDEVLRKRSNNRAIEERVQHVSGYEVDIIDLGFRDDLLDTNLTGDNLNDAGDVAGPYNPSSTHPALAFINDLGLTPPLYWGDPGDGIYLHAAFAVILGQEFDTIAGRDMLEIYRAVDEYRAAGTVAMLFSPVTGQLLDTNVLLDTTNTSGIVAGPRVPSYQYHGVIQGPYPEFEEGMLAIPGYGVAGIMIAGFN